MRSDSEDRFRLLGLYLNDHLAGAYGGAELARRIADRQQDGDRADELRRLATDVAADREQLLRLMRTLGVPVRRYRQWLGVAGERIGRVKLNGRLLQRSPLSDLLELEAMRIGIEGKIGLWRSLRRLGSEEGLLAAAALDRLTDRALAQAALVESCHASVSAALFPPETAPPERAGQPAHHGAGRLRHA